MQEKNFKKNKIFILGAGVAGISCALKLVQSGFETVLIEASPAIGGRMRSFRDKKFGEILDNGQHLFAGAYESFFALLKFFGTYDILEFQRNMRVPFFFPGGEKKILNTGLLPGKAGVAAGIMSLKGVGALEKIAALNFARKIVSGRARIAGKTVLALLAEHGQNGAICETFWEPIVLATLNCPGEKASAEVFARVLRKAFFGGEQSAKLAFSKAAFSELLAPFEKKFEKMGGRLILSNSARKIEISQNRIVKVKLRNGSIENPAAVVACLPPDRLNALLPDAANLAKMKSDLQKFKFSTIVSAYLKFDRKFADESFGALMRARTHWFFDMSEIRRDLVKGGDRIISITTSAAESFNDISQKELLDIHIEDLRGAFPAANKARLLNWKIIRDRRATALIDAETHSIRPKSETPLENLFIAGDWTDTGLPATLESAAQSGETAAKAVSANNLSH